MLMIEPHRSLATPLKICRRRLICSGLNPAFLLLAVSLNAYGAVYTLSPQGIRLLDVELSQPANLVKIPTSEGVIYEITVPNNTAWNSTSVSWNQSGQKALVGIPTQPGDTLALQYTLLAAPTPNTRATVSAIINHTQPGGTGWIPDPKVLGGAGGSNVVVSSAVTDQTLTMIVGSTIYTTNDTGTWPVNGGTMRILVSPAPGASVIGPAGPQLIWTNDATRQTTIWQIAGVRTQLQRSWWWIHPTGVPGWKIVAMADFNRDGSTDLVWQNDATRQSTVWYQTSPASSTTLGWNWISSAGLPGWSIIGAADFNRDGSPDLVFQNDTTRQVTVWYLGGAQGNALLGWNWLSAAGQPGWSAVAAADINRDGVADLIWQNDATRQATVWYMSGAQGNVFAAWDWISAGAMPGWRIVAASDVDADGITDVVWQNEATREATVWYMSGAQGNVFAAWDWISNSLPGWSITAGR
jgi:hypothetical protein